MLYQCELENGAARLTINVDVNDNVVSATLVNHLARSIGVNLLVTLSPAKTFNATRVAESGEITVNLPPQFNGIKGADCAFALWEL